MGSVRLIHPEDGGWVRALSVAAGERLVPQLRCDACHRALGSDEVRAATAAQAARWASAPVTVPRLSTGQYLSPPHAQGGSP